MTFSTYLLSIVGISVAGILIEIIMPDGEMQKYVKGVFSIFLIFAIITPIPKLLRGSENVSTINLTNGKSEISFDKDYVNYVNGLIVDNKVKDSIKDIKRITGVEVDVQFLYKDKEINVINVFADKQVISGNTQHILFTDNVKMYFVTKYSVQNDQVNVIWK